MEHPAILFPDVELLVTRWLRPRLPQCLVTNQLRDHDQLFAVVVVDDSGPDAMVTAQRRVRLICRGDTMATTSALARYVASLMRQIPLDTAAPVAAVGQIFGPHRNDDPTERAEYQLSAEITIIGTPAPDQPTYL